MRRTGFIFRQECLLHDTGPGHPERASRLPAILEAFHMAGLNPPRLTIAPASKKELARIHTRDYINEIERTCREGLHYPDPDMVMVRESWVAALLAAGGAIGACQAVLAGEYDSVFAAVRPPGHHAEPDRAMGFCLFNNVAIAAAWLRAEAGVRRVAIVDWDVHHGNGTERAFYRDDTVYYASLHQHPLYPGTGHPSERGKNNTNLNIQLPPGSGPEAWLGGLQDRVMPEIEQFDPEFLLISCGFDAHRLDPLASQRLESESFAEMTRLVKPLAGGKIVSLLEGGYDLTALGESAVAHFRALQES
ncbi:MAG: histone deacetylase [Candidatus Hydrogenedentes bacterium]|nr:histone deacetylase [Candidatus Hydrogenedentota bacterium]